MASTTISTRLDETTLEKLQKLAAATNRSKSFLTAEAIEKYIEEQMWQIEAISQGLTEADNGNFATEKEITVYQKKWGMIED